MENKKMADFKQAVEWLKEGKKVCRLIRPDIYYYLHSDTLIYFTDKLGGWRKEIYLEDYDATDWEIYEKMNRKMEEKKVTQIQTINKLTKDEIMLLKKLVYYEKVRVEDEIRNFESPDSKKEALVKLQVKLSNKSVYGDLLDGEEE